MQCPRCGSALAAMRWGDVTVDLCGACSGVLVGQAALPHLLKQLSASLADAVDLESPWPNVDDSGTIPACPRCAAPVDHDGYMGMKAVFIDRCGRCRGVWIDPAELGVMALMYARNEAVLEAGRRRHRARIQSMRTLDAIGLASAVSDRLASHLISG